MNDQLIKSSKEINMKWADDLTIKGKFLVGTVPLLIFASFTMRITGQKEAMRPNMIIIVADDLGWKDVGYHGSEIKTPTLDKMAIEGAVFNRFYVHSVCSPTRASLLTGRFPGRFGIFSPLGDEPGLPAGTTTLAELLRQNGYETAISGKWHLGATPEARPRNYGFDVSYGYLRGQIDPYTHLYKNGDTTWHRNDLFVKETGHATDLITTEALRFIAKPREKNRPFFLLVTYSVPHYPLEEPDHWSNVYKGIIKNKSRREYAASVTHMDNEVNKILTALEKNHLDKNTMILFFSDNGGQKSWYPKDEYNNKFDSHAVLGNNLPLRAWKTWAYDGALRVPALLYWPEVIKHRNISEHLNVADVFPTFARLAGASLDDNTKIDGIDFWPALEGKRLSEDRIMYWRMANFIALKKGDWKLIRFLDKNETVREELYNITLDPYEEKNVAAEESSIVDKLQKHVEEQLSMDQTL